MQTDSERVSDKPVYVLCLLLVIMRGRPCHCHRRHRRHRAPRYHGSAGPYGEAAPQGARRGWGALGMRDGGSILSRASHRTGGLISGGGGGALNDGQRV